MIEYSTRAELIRIGEKTLLESVAKVTKAENREAKNATFLSHSSKDNEVMPGVVYILEGHGAVVYLDKKDPTLLNKSPKEIATSLRERISACRKFIVFASEHIRSSAWVPWELGLADGYKKSRNVCLFPALSVADEFEWTEQEYLGIYDRIVWGNFDGQKPEWLVYNHKANSAVQLNVWLER